jgi:hypothetical protein
MPVVRYLVVVGGVLLALLLAVERHLPAVADRSAETDVDRGIIRIRSAQTFPERIVFDTAASAGVAVATPVASESIDPEQHDDPRRALAMMPAEPAGMQPAKVTVNRTAERRAPRAQRAPHRHDERRVAMQRREPW